MEVRALCPFVATCWLEVHPSRVELWSCAVKQKGLAQAPPRVVVVVNLLRPTLNLGPCYLQVPCARQPLPAGQRRQLGQGCGHGPVRKGAQEKTAAADSQMHCRCCRSCEAWPPPAGRQAGTYVGMPAQAMHTPSPAHNPIPAHNSQLLTSSMGSCLVWLLYLATNAPTIHTHPRTCRPSILTNPLFQCWLYRHCSHLQTTC